MGIPDVYVVRFEPGAPPRMLDADTGYPRQTELALPALSTGAYELWLPGHRPLRVDTRPTKPLQVMLGYPVDVAWRESAEVPEGNRIKVEATWRGPGDHPEALVRAQFPSAAPSPKEQSWAWIEFVKGVLIEPSAPTARLYVPWPGAYRLRFYVGPYRIRETPLSFSGTGGGSSSPNHRRARPCPGTVARTPRHAPARRLARMFHEQPVAEHRPWHRQQLFAGQHLGSQRRALHATCGLASKWVPLDVPDQHLVEGLVAPADRTCWIWIERIGGAVVVVRRYVDATAGGHIHGGA